jgi:two-component sensor histidine kinase
VVVRSGSRNKRKRPQEVMMTISRLANCAAARCSNWRRDDPTLSQPDGQTTMPLKRKSIATAILNRGGVASTQRWIGEWSGDQLNSGERLSDDNCTDQTGAVCTRLAEARARQELAELQLAEFNHRLANVLQKLVTRIDRQRRTQEDPAKRDELASLMASVHASARLHRYLLPPRTQKVVDLGTLIENMANAIEDVTGLLCSVQVEPVHVSSQVAVHLAAAVNELAWNAHKHAYGGMEGGRLRILCRHEADGRLRLSVADQGCGLPAGFDPNVSEGLGLMVVCATARQFRGELHVESHRGARFTLLLSVPGA